MGSGLSTHSKGFLIAFIGVLALTPDALLVRLADMDVWQLVFWRNALTALTLLSFLLIFYRKKFIENIKAVGLLGFLIGFIMALSSLFFILAFEYASAAKVLVTISLIPMLSGLLSVLLLKEAINTATIIACVMSVFGIGIVASDSFLGEQAGRELEFIGIGFALFTALSVSLAFTLMRLKRSVNMVPATALGALVLSLILLPFVFPLNIQEWQLFPVLSMGMFVSPVSLALLSLAPRYIPSSEVGLLMLLETCLGPFWVWLVLNEQPANMVLLGGVIIITTLIGHGIYSLRREQKTVEA